MSSEQTDSVSGGEIKEFHFDRVIEPRKKRVKKLEQMNCWEEVKSLIEDATPVMEIVRFIQGERKEYIDVKPNTLRVTIHQWIKENRSSEMPVDRVPTRHLDLLNSSTERLDPLDAVNMLFAIHMDRVMISYDHEKKLNMTMSQNTHNIRLATDMAKTMASISADELKYRLRLKSNQPQSVNDTMDQVERVKKIYEARYGATAATVAMDPQARRRVYRALTMVRKGNTEEIAKILEESGKKSGGGSQDGSSEV